MDPLTPINTMIDKTEEFLGHSPHPAIVSVPIGAWTVSNVCDMMGMVRGCDRYDDAARLSMGIGLTAATGAIVTGIRDYGYIPKERPSHKVATRHALGNAVVGSLFAASFILRVRDRQAGRPTGWLARGLGLAGGGLAWYTAWLGGKLVEEYGEAVKPVMEHMEEDESHPAWTRGRGRLDPTAPLGTRRS